ncbi:MAG TPA: hypothetical protein VGO49_04415 [Bradyrhizobium sp.]|jgi:hypothetical protein|nr:hypothetical protein [Bradyrhizobium sp.]
MSVLETPRLYFRGKTTWDPIVTNNRPAQYNEGESKTVFNAAAIDVAAFRKDAIAAVIKTNSAGQQGISNWNPHGTHRSTFYETSVVGVDVGNGTATDDPIVKCPVSLTGMLVDLEPYGALSSQVFFDAMSFGIQGGCQVFAPRSTRMTARYINFARNSVGFIAGIASVVWQTSFPKAAGLRVEPHHSPALQKLAAALQEDDDVLGLTVRWNAYRTIYFDSVDPTQNNLAVGRQLQTALMGGGFQPNPARSELVGVLGLWRKGEPVSEPGDRALLTNDTSPLASAHVRLTTDQLVLDFANSVPETGLNLEKLDLGNLTAVAVGADGKTMVSTLGSFGYDRYNREAYQASAGIVTIKVDPAAAQKAQTADIQLRQDNGTVLLAEAALRAIPAVPNIYLDEGESSSLDVQVLDRGKPASSGIAVTMANPLVSSAPKVTNPTNAQGIATFPIAGAAGQVTPYVLVPGQGATIPAGLPDPQLTTYVYVRTRPADANIAQLEPTWDNVHKYVLRNWQAMAPCMDNWLNLGDPEQVKSFAPILRKLTDKANFESFLFMPVTRDMTAGERTLLYAFLDSTPTLTAAARAAPRRRSVAELSRAMRGG